MMNTMEILPGASADVNSRLKEYSVIMAIEGKLDQTKVRDVEEKQKQLLADWKLKEADVKSAINKGMSAYEDRMFGQEIGGGVRKVLRTYAETWGPHTAGDSLQEKINSLIGKGYATLKSGNMPIIAESKYNFVSSHIEDDWFGDTEVMFPLENYKIWNTKTQEMDSSWHETAVVNLLQESAPEFGDEWEGNWDKLELGDNIAVTPLTILKGPSLTTPGNIDYAIMYENNDGMWSQVLNTEGRPIIYSPERITAFLAQAQRNDTHDLNIIEKSIDHFRSIGEDEKAEELIREQTGIRATYKEALKRHIPNYNE